MADDPAASYRNLFWLWLRDFHGRGVAQIARGASVSQETVRRGILDARGYIGQLEGDRRQVLRDRAADDE